MPILKFDGWRVEGRAQRPLKDAPQPFFLNMAQLVSAVPTTYHLTAEQVAALPPTEPPRRAGDHDGYLLRMVGEDTYFVVETDAAMTTRLITLASP